MPHSPRWLVVPSALLLGALAAAQANRIPGLDLRLSAMRTLEVAGREGVFPDGMNGVAVETTVCNEGTVEIEWHQPMNEHHPKISFLVGALRDGRIVQLSNRSYVKHGFFALNGRACGNCQPPTTIGEYLGIGCSDTYGTVNNADNFYLGPPDEIDPWLGTWNHVCSLFDRGYPDVGAPDDCDGHRSLTHQAAGMLGPVNSRLQVSDEDLILGGELFFQGQYVVEGLDEAGRDNATGSRSFTAAWDGVRWLLTASGPLVDGSALQRWPGALLGSATNGDDDGRVFVAVKVTGPEQGFYHYEYALHNRDNARGVGALRIPICPGARVRNAGFRDVDRDAANDWSFAHGAQEIAFTCQRDPQPWNTIYNFWFDSDAAPDAAGVALEEFTPGPGAPSFLVATQAPTLLLSAWLGPGCALDTPPTLYAVGSPALGRLGNASFGLESSGNVPFEPNVLFAGFQPGMSAFQGCTLWTGAGAPVFVSSVLSDASGVALHPCPVPNSLALEGKAIQVQAVGRDPGHGPLFRSFELSDGLLVRIGNTLPVCP